MQGIEACDIKLLRTQLKPEIIFCCSEMEEQDCEWCTMYETKYMIAKSYKKV